MVGLGTGKTECPMGPWVMLIIPWSINKWIDRGGGVNTTLLVEVSYQWGMVCEFTHQSVCTHRIPGHDMSDRESR